MSKMITVLECNAEECANNKNQCCCKGEINVKGACASHTDGTCCGDFQKRGSSTASNSCGCSTPNRSVEINCDAEGCMYNNEHRCFADRIGISGAGVSTAEKTQCATFRPRG